MATIQVNKIVYIKGALDAVTREFEGSDEFWTWSMKGHPGIGFEAGALRSTGVIDVGQATVLADDAPDTPAGRAWADRVRQNIKLAVDDTIRAYDMVDSRQFDELLEPLLNVAGTVEDRSPLLAPVADAIYAFGDPHHLVAEVASLGEGVLSDHAIYCHRDWIPWTDIELLMPGLGDRVRAEVARVRAAVPEFAEDDHGVARGRAL